MFCAIRVVFASSVTVTNETRFEQLEVALFTRYFPPGKRLACETDYHM